MTGCQANHFRQCTLSLGLILISCPSHCFTGASQSSCAENDESNASLVRRGHRRNRRLPLGIIASTASPRHELTCFTDAKFVESSRLNIDTIASYESP